MHSIQMASLFFFPEEKRVASAVTLVPVGALFNCRGDDD
jgi:hypothetical protein